MTFSSFAVIRHVVFNPMLVHLHLHTNEVGTHLGVVYHFLNHLPVVCLVGVVVLDDQLVFVATVFRTTFDNSNKRE